MTLTLIEKTVRFGFALLLLGNSLNILLNVFPLPDMDMKAKLILGALERSGYIMTVGAIIQLVSSLLYLANRFVTVANLLILPTIFNLLLFSIFLEPMALVIILPMVGALSYLIYLRRDIYKLLFQQT